MDDASTINLIMKGVGGISGGVSGALGASRNKKELYDLAGKTDEQKQQIAAVTGQRVADLEKMYGPQLEGFDENTKSYQDALKGADYSQFNVAAPGDFDFDLNAETQRQLNPELQAIIDRTTGTVQQSHANAGSLFSGAAGKDIARSTADIQAKEWDAAAQRANQQQQNKYQQYIDKFRNAQTAAEFNRGNYTSTIGAKKDLFNTQQGAFGQKTGLEQDLLNSGDTAQAKLQSDYNALTAKAKNSPGMLEGAVSGMASGLGGTTNTEK